MVLRTNRNEGVKFIDSDGYTYAQFNASNNSAGAYKTTFSGDVELAANLFSTGNNLKFHAGGTHVMNIDLNGKVYPNVNNAYDLGHSTSLAWRHLYLSLIHISEPTRPY